jgi:hypothetical protein
VSNELKHFEGKPFLDENEVKNILNKYVLTHQTKPKLLSLKVIAEIRH